MTIRIFKAAVLTNVVSIILVLFCLWQSAAFLELINLLLMWWRTIESFAILWMVFDWFIEMELILRKRLTERYYLENRRFEDWNQIYTKKYCFLFNSWVVIFVFEVIVFSLVVWQSLWNYKDVTQMNRHWRCLYTSVRFQSRYVWKFCALNLFIVLFLNPISDFSSWD